MKNIQLTYDFPKRLLRPLRIEGLQVYISGQNLWTLSDFDLWDPEITTTRTNLYEYPNLKTISVGLNLSFYNNPVNNEKESIFRNHPVVCLCGSLMFDGFRTDGRLQR